MVNEDFIGPTARRELTICGDRNRVNWIYTLRQRLPVDRTRNAHLSGRALVDPELQKTEILRFQGNGVYLILPRRHERIGILMRRCFEEKAFSTFARDHDRTGIAALENRLWRLEDQSRFRLGLAMAGQAIIFEDGQD